MKISACWIVKNEAKNIAASIESVRNCADELIVVDTGSTDGTVRAAEECAARVEHFEWTQDFSAARNYCLSLATGDYVIFIDGDEYFAPALTEADRNAIFGFFERNNADVLQIPRDEVDETGIVTGTTIHGRILRRATIKYSGRIHELPVLLDDSTPRLFLLKEYLIKHTGYSGDLKRRKALRNISIMEDIQPESEDGANLLIRNAYFLREYATIGDFNKANGNCRYLLDHYKMWASVCKDAAFDFIQFFYAAIYVASAQRSLYSRAEIYEKLFREIKHNYPDSRDAVLADLYYQALFDYREDRFLQELGEAEKRLADLPSSEVAESKQVEALIYSRAASAEYFRGNIEEAARLAQITRQMNPDESRAEMDAILGADDNSNVFSERVDETDAYAALLAVVGKFVLRGEYREAYELIIPQVEGGSLDHNLLRFLLIIAEKAMGELAENARERYEVYWALLNETIDLRDLINTDYVGIKTSYTRERSIEDITFEQFLDGYNRDMSRPMTQECLNLHNLAAQRFEKSGLTVAALRSYSLLLAKSVAEAQNKLNLIMRLLLSDGGDILAERLHKAFEAKN